MTSAAGRRRSMIFVAIPSPDVAALAIRSGVETVVLDCEHGFPLGPEVREMAQACKLAAGRCLVRIAPSQVSHIGVLADLGVDGVVLSSVRALADVTRAVRSVLFPPSGDRSVNPFVPASNMPGDTDRLRQAAKTFEVWAMAETREFLEDLRAPTRGVDESDSWVGGIIGPYDMAAALDCAPDPEDDTLRDAVELYIARLAERGLEWALFVRDLQALQRWISVGINPPTVVIGYDRDIWAQACLTRVNDLT